MSDGGPGGVNFGRHDRPSVLGDVPDVDRESFAGRPGPALTVGGACGLLVGATVLLGLGVDGEIALLSTASVWGCVYYLLRYGWVYRTDSVVFGRVFAQCMLAALLAQVAAAGTTGAARVVAPLATAATVIALVQSVLVAVIDPEESESDGAPSAADVEPGGAD
mgnify:CR=1 FL=1